MRELKFRAWDDKNKKWLLGYEYPNLGGFSMLGETMAFGEYEAMLNSFSLEDWGKIKLMQSTGLKDKNSKEIYEGDIVKCGYGMAEVVFHAGCFMAEWIDDREANMETLFSWNNMSPRKGIDSFEVIGNIYENKELVTQPPAV